MPAYQKHSDTSKAAALSMSVSAASIREQVFAYIKKHGPKGRTCDEVEVDHRLRHQTASARIRELVQEGRLKDSGIRRKTRSGRKAVAWVVVALALLLGACDEDGRSRSSGGSGPVSPIPEPKSYVLFALGAGMLAIGVRKARKQSQGLSSQAPDAEWAKGRHQNYDAS